jgi:hypothetical protein
MTAFYQAESVQLLNGDALGILINLPLKEFLNTRIGPSLRSRKHKAIQYVLRDVFTDDRNLPILLTLLILIIELPIPHEIFHHHTQCREPDA